MKTTMVFNLVRLDKLEKCLRWINKKHYGEETVPLDVEAAESHKEAVHQLRMGRHVEVIATLNPDGTFTPLSAMFDGKSYKFIAS